MRHVVWLDGVTRKTISDLDVRGSGGGDRTHDLRINSPTLCQLSYPGMGVRRIPAAPDHPAGPTAPDAVSTGGPSVLVEVVAEPL